MSELSDTKEHLRCCAAELVKMGASISVIERRLTDPHGTAEDRIRWALLHIEAVRTGRATPLAADSDRRVITPSEK